MAIYVEIVKQESQNDIVYSVKTELADTKVFYVQVLPDKKELRFFEDIKFTKKLGKVDLTDVEKKIEIKGISPAVYGRVIIQTSKALKKNEFPHRLDYAA